MKKNRHKFAKSIGAVILAVTLVAAVGGYVPKMSLAAGGNVTVALANAEGLAPGTEFDFTLYKVGHFSGPGLELEDNLKGSGADVSFPADSTESETDKAKRMLTSASNLAKYIDDNKIELTPIGGIHKLKPGNSFNQAVEENALYLVRSNTVRDSAEGSKFNWTPQPVYVAILNGDSSITLSNSVVTKIIKTPAVLNHRVEKKWDPNTPEGLKKPEAVFVNIRYAGKIVDTVRLESKAGYAYAWSSEEDGDTYKYIGTDDSGNKKEVTFKPDAEGNPKWSCDEILDADEYAASFADLAYEGVVARTFSNTDKEAISDLAKRFLPEYTDPDNLDPALYPVDQAQQIAIHEIYNVYAKNELKLTKSFVRDYKGIDSFRVYMCLSGECAFLSPEGQGIFLHAGESLVVPASTPSVTIVPDEQAKLLESYVE